MASLRGGIFRIEKAQWPTQPSETHHGVAAPMFGGDRLALVERASASGFARFGCKDVHLVNEELRTLCSSGQAKLNAAVAVLNTNHDESPPCVVVNGSDQAAWTWSADESIIPELCSRVATKHANNIVKGRADTHS